MFYRFSQWTGVETSAIQCNEDKYQRLHPKWVLTCWHRIACRTQGTCISITSAKSFNIVTIVKTGRGLSWHSNSGWLWGPKENMCLWSTLEAQMIKETSWTTWIIIVKRRRAKSVKHIKVTRQGLEPRTFWICTKRSNHWAIRPYWIQVNNYYITCYNQVTWDTKPKCHQVHQIHQCRCKPKSNQGQTKWQIT